MRLLLATLFVLASGSPGLAQDLGPLNPGLARLPPECEAVPKAP
jgi:hypothetical protein